jgi:hypothetical protein
VLLQVMFCDTQVGTPLTLWHAVRWQGLVDGGQTIGVLTHMVLGLPLISTPLGTH